MPYSFSEKTLRRLLRQLKLAEPYPNGPITISTRELSCLLGLNRKNVMTAITKLEQRGWVRTDPAPPGAHYPPTRWVLATEMLDGKKKRRTVKGNPIFKETTP